MIRSGSGKIWGTCRIADCIGPLYLETLRQNQNKHQIPLDELEELPYPQTYAWALEDVREMREPLEYAHPSGAVIWVTLTERNVQRFDVLREAGLSRAAKLLTPAAQLKGRRPQREARPALEAESSLGVSISGPISKDQPSFLAARDELVDELDKLSDKAGDIKHAR